MWCLIALLSITSQDLSFVRFISTFSVPLSCSHLVTDQGKFFFFFFLAQKDPKLSWWWKVCYSLQFVIFEPTNVRAQSCSSDCHRGQKERSLFAKFHNLPVRCYLVWKTHSDKFFTSCLAVPKNYICLTAGSQPGFSLTLPAFLFVSLLAW